MTQALDHRIASLLADIENDAAWNAITSTRASEAVDLVRLREYAAHETAVRRVDCEPGALIRTVANQTLADNPGIVAPNYLPAEAIRLVLAPAQPFLTNCAVDIIGTRGQLPAIPEFDLAPAGAQAVEKTDVPSEKLDIPLQEDTVATIAFGLDISTQNDAYTRANWPQGDLFGLIVGAKVAAGVDSFVATTVADVATTAADFGTALGSFTGGWRPTYVASSASALFELDTLRLASLGITSVLIVEGIPASTLLVGDRRGTWVIHSGIQTAIETRPHELGRDLAAADLVRVAVQPDSVFAVTSTP